MTLQAAAPESPKGTIGACVFTAFFAPFYFLAVVALYLFLFALALPGGDGAATETSIAAFREEHRTLIRTVVWVLFGAAAWAGLAAVRRIFKRADQKRVTVFFGCYYLLLVALAALYLGAIGTLLLQGAVAVVVVCVLMYRMSTSGSAGETTMGADRAFIAPHAVGNEGIYRDLAEEAKHETRTFAWRPPRGQRIGLLIIGFMVFFGAVPGVIVGFAKPDYAIGVLCLAGATLMYLVMRRFMSKARWQQKALTIDSAKGLIKDGVELPWTEIGRVWQGDGILKSLLAIELSKTGVRTFYKNRTWLQWFTNRASQRNRYLPNAEGQFLLDANFYEEDVSEIVSTLHRLRPGPSQVDPETRGMAETV